MKRKFSLSKSILALLVALVVFLGSIPVSAVCFTTDIKPKEVMLYRTYTYAKDGSTMPYRLYVPEDYDTAKSYPVVVFLHGADKHGSDNEAQLDYMIDEVFEYHYAIKDSIVIAPQCTYGKYWVETDWTQGTYDNSYPDRTELKKVVRIVEEICEEYSVNKNRIYAMGLSMGGFGTWSLLMNYSKIFAAGVPICGAADPEKASVLKDIPIWAFHGINDSVVPYSGTSDVVDAILAAGGTKIKFDTYDSDHWIWWDVAMNERIVDWLFEQKLSDRLPSAAADYTKLNEVVDSIPEDTSVYTGQSLKAVNSILDSIDWTLAPDRQTTVDLYASKLAKAVSELELIPAASITAADASAAVTKLTGFKQSELEIYDAYLNALSEHSAEGSTYKTAYDRISNAIDKLTSGYTFYDDGQKIGTYKTVAGNPDSDVAQTYYTTVTNPAGSAITLYKSDWSETVSNTQPAAGQAAVYWDAETLADVTGVEYSADGGVTRHTVTNAAPFDVSGDITLYITVAPNSGKNRNFYGFTVDPDITASGDETKVYRHAMLKTEGVFAPYELDSDTDNSNSVYQIVWGGIEATKNGGTSDFSDTPVAYSISSTTGISVAQINVNGIYLNQSSSYNGYGSFAYPANWQQSYYSLSDAATGNRLTSSFNWVSLADKSAYDKYYGGDNGVEQIIPTGETVKDFSVDIYPAYASKVIYNYVDQFNYSYANFKLSASNGAVVLVQVVDGVIANSKDIGSIYTSSTKEVMQDSEGNSLYYAGANQLQTHTDKKITMYFNWDSYYNCYRLSADWPLTTKAGLNSNTDEYVTDYYVRRELSLLKTYAETGEQLKNIYIGGADLCTKKITFGAVAVNSVAEGSADPHIHSSAEGYKLGEYGNHYKICDICGLDYDFGKCTEGSEGVYEGEHYVLCSGCKLPYGEKLSHTYNKQLVSTAALATAATCTTNAVYYYSCECGGVDKSNTWTAENSAKGHTLTTLKAKAATCTSTGLTAGKKCSVCGTETVAQKEVAKKAHTYKTTATKATLSKNGSKVTKCSVCGYKKSSSVIYKISSVKLATTTYTYTGKAISPAVTVKNSKGTKLVKGTDYTVSYAGGRKNVGKYKVTITFKGNYSGKKILYFTINPTKTTVKKLTPATKALKVSITKKSAQVSGYQIQYSTAKSFSGAKALKITGTSKTIKSLKAKKTYYVRVRTYKKVGSTTYYSAWSAAKKAKTK